MEKVSIIIPTFNDADYLEDCLMSIFNQTYDNIEIIVVNDGSTDGTIDIMNKFKNRIISVSKKNEGPSVARNLGIQKSSGKYLMFVDADDIITSNAVELLVTEIEKEDFDLAVASQYSFNRKNKISKRTDNISQKVYSNEKIFQVLYPYFNTNMVNPPISKLYRKEIIRKNNIQFDVDLSLGEDFIFNLNYYKAIESCVFFNKCIYGVRQSSNYLTKRYSGEFKNNKEKMFLRAQQILLNKGVSQSFLNGQFIRICFSYMLEIQNRRSDLKTSQKLHSLKKILRMQRLNDALNDYLGSQEIDLLALILKHTNLLLLYFFLFIINKVKHGG